MLSYLDHTFFLVRPRRIIPLGVKWLLVLAMLVLHPVLLYLLFPVFGEASNLIIFAGPVVVTLLFRFWLGIAVILINSFVTAVVFSYISDMGPSEGLPKAFIAILVTAIICFGVDCLRSLVELRRSLAVEFDPSKKKEIVRAKWALVITVAVLHPVFLYLLFPMAGEAGNIVVLGAPILATLLFNWRAGVVFSIINVTATRLVFSQVFGMGPSEGQPKMVLLFIVVAVIVFGSEHLRRYILQRREMATELVQAKKMEAVGRLAGGVAHDMNNTLNAIMGSVYAHRQALAADGQVYRDLDDIIAACERGAQLTRNLLGFARKSNYKKQAFSLNAVVESVRSILSRTASKDIRIEERTAHSLPLVEGDRGQIENAVMNLCLNALDAMGDRGTLILATGVERESVFICVSDTGTGIDESIRERVFEPFFTTKEEGKGTGLGLSMVYGVVHAMGGNIVLESAPEQGTTFILRFPQTAAVEPDPDLSSMPPEPARKNDYLRGRTVLIIDDEPLVLRSGVRVLKTLGCDVLSAPGGREGVALFKENAGSISLVIVDLIMPDMDGVATLEEILAVDEYMPVLLVSGYTRESEKMEDLKDRRATVRFLAKPYKPDELIKAAKYLFEDGPALRDSETHKAG
jgi:signal transduction histidine kinase/CheY-like chemotaxis protein